MNCWQQTRDFLDQLSGIDGQNHRNSKLENTRPSIADEDCCGILCATTIVKKVERIAWIEKLRVQELAKIKD